MAIHWGIQVAGSQSLPVTLAEAKNFCRVNSTADDSWFSTIGIPSARNYVEAVTGRALVATQYLMTLDRFPFPSNYDRNLYAMDAFLPMGPSNAPYYDMFAIRMQRNPVATVDALKYLDTTGTLQTMDPSLYVLDNVSLQARVLPAFPAGGLGGGWPIALYQANAVQISFTAGAATVAAAAPELKAAILLHVSMQQESKGGSDPDKTRATKETIDNLLQPFVIPNTDQT